PSNLDVYQLHADGLLGRFSVVILCREEPSGMLYAAKVTPYRAEWRQWALREYQLLRKLCHAHLARLHCTLIWPHHLMLIQELCPGRELLHHLAERSDNVLVGEDSQLKVVDLGSAQVFVPGQTLPGGHLGDLIGSPGAILTLLLCLLQAFLHHLSAD
uniref:Protein kinase domain-containing protein n=1 Tax=Paramormyrops kingsleyae TaxID=1676925 RepID=A0A3B3RSM3_9TELE